MNWLRGKVVFQKMFRALAKSASDINYDFKILNSVMDVNEDQKTRLSESGKQVF